MANGINDNSLPKMRLYSGSNTPSGGTIQYSKPIGPSANFGSDRKNQFEVEQKEPDPKLLERIAPESKDLANTAKARGGKYITIPNYKIDPFIPEPYKTDRVIEAPRATLPNETKSKTTVVKSDENFIKIENPEKAANDILNGISNNMKIATLQDLRTMYSILKSIPMNSYEYSKLREHYEKSNNIAAIIKNIVEEDNVTTLKKLVSATDVHSEGALIFKSSDLYIDSKAPLSQTLKPTSINAINELLTYVATLPQEEKMQYISTIYNNTNEDNQFTSIYFLSKLNQQDPSFISNFANYDLQTQDLIMKKLLGEYAYDHTKNSNTDTSVKTSSTATNNVNQEKTVSNSNNVEKAESAQTDIKKETNIISNQKLFEMYQDLENPGRSEDPNRSPFDSWKHRDKNDASDIFIARCMYQIATQNEIKQFYDIYKHIDPDRSAPRALRNVLRNQIELSWGIQGNITRTQNGKLDTFSTLNNFKNNVQINENNEITFTYKSQQGMVMVKKVFNKDVLPNYFSMNAIDTLVKDISDWTNEDKARSYLNACNASDNEYLPRPLTQYEKIALFKKLADTDPNFIQDNKIYEQEMLDHLLGKYSTN